MNPHSIFPSLSISRLPSENFSTARAPLIRIAVGETVEADVLDQYGPGRFLLSLKNERLLARSGTALQAGDRILVRVERLSPEVLLSLLDIRQAGAGEMVDHLRWYRANPDALGDLLAQLMDWFNPEAPGGPAGSVAGEDARQALRLAESLFFRGDVPEKGRYLENYLKNLGLLMESSLGALVNNRPGVPGPSVMDLGLKGLLLKMLAALAKPGEGNAAETGTAALKNLAAFLETSVKTIEAHQVVNVLYHEREDGYALQIPFAFPEGTRMSEIFIRRDGAGAETEDGERSYEAVCLLDMDALGRIVVEAKIRRGRIGCLIRCEQDDVRDFISTALGDLKSACLAAGCRVDSVECLVEADLEDRCEAYVRDHLFDGDTVNILA